MTIGVLLLNLLQQPGRVTFDTKLDLQLGPGDLLSRSLSLWNGDWALGGLQNQASGYLFPMGPAFWLGDVLGVPAWVWERLWSAAVMLLAYEGARRLARSWPGVGVLGSVLAGAAYMLAPRVLTTVGGLSGETLPGAVLPWTVLPLVLYLRGRVRARVGILASVATIPVMGGQNATLVAACLVMPALLLALGEGRPWRRRLRDLTAWSALVLVVTAWWLVPLLLLGGYAPPFLDFIESSRNTAAGTGWLASLRGTSHWVAFFPGGGPLGWVGGYELASSRLLVLPTVLVAGAGLAGLALRRTWQRGVLVASVLVGLAVLTAGSGAPAGSVLSGWWLDALDGALAPLRNVHKWDPVVRLPLSLGLGALVSAVPATWSWRRLPRAVPARRLVLAASALAVLAATLPAVTGSLRTADGMEDLPASWRDTARYLDAQTGPVRAMVLPGAGFAVQVWGRTVDEPIQVLDAPPWLARAQVTVAPGGTLALLDALEESVSRARPQPSLAASFARLGMTHVVLRHDLDPDETDAPSPDVVEAGVASTPGLDRVAGYGPEVGGRQQVEVYAVTTLGDPRAAIADAASVRRVSGGPEAVADLVASGLLASDQPTVLVGADQRADVVTDTRQRVERSFGRVHATVSGAMTAQDRFRVDRREHDFTDPDVPTAQTTATYVGAQDVVASSSGGYADVLGPVRPEQHPYAAFDDSGFTSWATAPLRDPTGQWIEVRFGSPVELGPVALTFDHFDGAVVRTVRLSTDAGRVAARVDAEGAARDVELPEGRTSRLRITLDDVRGTRAQVRLADVSLEGREVRRSLRLPGRVTAGTAVHLSAEEPRRACVTLERGLSCEQRRQLVTPETTGFDRTLQVTEPGTWEVGGSVVATNGPALERLFAPLDPRRVSVTATSTYAGDPAVVPANALDGRRGTGWLASPLDPAPALALTWQRPRTIRSVEALLEPGQPGRLPEALLVDPLNGEEPQLVATSGPDAGTLEPFRTRRLRIAASGGTGDEGVGISELRVDGLQRLRHAASPDTPTGTACGFGPVVAAGGRVVPTEVVGTLADVVAGRELEVRACGDDLSLPAGVQRLGVGPPAGFAVTDLWLRPTGWEEASEGSGPTATVERWGDTGRTVAVTAPTDAVLSVPESRNAGWVATVDGRELRPLVVDGWKQAWRVPAGTDGPVRLVYAPQTTFVVSIVVGLVLAGLVALAALVLLVRARRRPAAGPPADPSPDPSPEPTARPAGGGRPGWAGRVAAGAGLVALVLVSVPLAVGAVVGRLTRAVPTPLAAASGLAALAVAGLIVVSGASAVSPPVGSDVVTALVVGALAGRVLLGPGASGRP
ncbi:alpha-(1-_3)-arabinofuranosyltransferase domain-containing protein [Nocardioides aurantiacus]|uniref:Arabinofuranan 3-O-arabinosyltransferase n=1 Tax=Nocardioides aurantiacus TaxID=86796 RepID=A0A3N2CV47_9ACTN|nr:alpha-(1->3)-arabinofuranosyltransferase family protein [Nocardioides aurantiacus]ROR91415.1 arabinofuranan 3-O-arabinosyltransferase [Nocardioides aurantiacus]